MTRQGNKELIESLGKIDPTKPYGTELFNALAKVTISIAIEAVCLRWNIKTKQIEVYLIQRSLDDTAYPGEWHCPGSILRPGESIDHVLFRLVIEELETPILKKRFVANVNHPTENRGHFFSIVYLCVLVENEALESKWFPVDSLPSKTLETHKKRIIPAAVGIFVAENVFICD